jgi:hypothetical protein
MATWEEARTRVSNGMVRLVKTAVSMVCVSLALALASSGQASEPDAGNKSWNATTESQDAAGGSTRTSESHRQSGNRTVDKQSVDVLRSGSYEPYQDVERESVKVNDTTTRSVVRTFGRDANGERVLIQQTEEEKQSLPGGGSKVVRSTMNPDANGGTQLVQREVQESKKISANVEETNTTVSLPNGNGGLAPALRTQERQEHSDEHTVQFRKSTLLPDGAGNWEVGEVRKGTITEDGKNRTKDEHVSRPGADGQLVEIEHTVGKDVETAVGEKHSTVDKYSADVPGESPDGSLHLVERTVTTDRLGANGRETRQQQVQQINPGDPSAGLQVTVVSTDSKSSGASGTKESRSVQVRGSNGSLDTVSVDMTKSDQTPAVQVQIAPREKAQ